jgi:pseudaminic acid cytidylyltransferase
MKIAIIPARGGSKRIPKKNIKEFQGMPMIAWAIKAAKESCIFDHIIVTTDDEEIASIAKKFGAQTPFVRPKDLADDITPTVPVIAHAVKLCIENNWPIEYVCCIYPCTPFLQTDDLIGGLKLLIDMDCNFVYPVAEYSHPIERGMRRLNTGNMKFISPQYELTRTQDLEKSYFDAGQFYWGKASAWLAHKKMHTDGVGMPIPNWRVVDIDSEDDWKKAELLFMALFKNK